MTASPFWEDSNFGINTGCDVIWELCRTPEGHTGVGDWHRVGQEISHDAVSHPSCGKWALKAELAGTEALARNSCSWNVYTHLYTIDNTHTHLYTYTHTHILIHKLIHVYTHHLGFPGSSAVEESACNAGESGSVSGSWRLAGEGIGYPLQYSWASLLAQTVKNLPAMWETWVWETWVPSLGWEDPLEEGMQPTQVFLSGESPWTEEPGGQQSMGSQRVRC